MRRLRLWASAPLLLALPLLALPLLAGCASIREVRPGGAMPGMLLTHTTYPNALGPGDRSRVVPVEPQDVEFLGPAEAEADSMVVKFRFYFSFTSGLYLVKVGGDVNTVSVGDSGYGALFEKMRAHTGADAFLNKAVSTHVTAVDLLLVRFDKVRTRASGLGIRLKRPVAVKGRSLDTAALSAQGAGPAPVGAGPRAPLRPQG
ncbi:MAG: hypothetical protein ACLF0G_16840 [Candidatus Brocadiia bacterium]